MTEIRVRFAETDQMGIAHHGAYVDWLEVGRVEWLRQHGYVYTELEAQGVSLAVAALELSYRQALRFDDVVRIEARVTAAASRGCSFAYRLIRSHDGVLAASGSTRHIAVDAAGAVQRLPATWLSFLRQHAQQERSQARC